jgi:hypothetical protein
MLATPASLNQSIFSVTRKPCLILKRPALAQTGLQGALHPKKWAASQYAKLPEKSWKLVGGFPENYDTDIGLNE